MEYKAIIVKKEQGIATITLNRPDKLNSMSEELLDELIEAVNDAEKDEETKVVVITGAGRGFCSGGDVTALSTGEMGGAAEAKDWVLRPGKYLVKKLMGLQKPVITAINGPAVGAGCGLALAGDYIIASDKARFSQIFVRIGLVPDAGSLYLLPRLVGIAKAKELCFSGEMIDAKEAERIGLVNRVVPAEELEATAMELASQLAKGPSKALAFIKNIINVGLFTNNIDAVMEHEAQAQAILFQTEDFKEGMKAFFEKRPPQFKGR